MLVINGHWQDAACWEKGWRVMSGWSLSAPTQGLASTGGEGALGSDNGGRMPTPEPSQVTARFPPRLGSRAPVTVWVIHSLGSRSVLLVRRIEKV